MGFVKYILIGQVAGVLIRYTVGPVRVWSLVIVGLLFLFTAIDDWESDKRKRELDRNPFQRRR